MAIAVCELCGSAAHLVCPSDEASLCTLCDSLVHGANFLVARHCRTFLCRLCSNPTASSRTGASIPLESHLCHRCGSSNDGSDEFPCHDGYSSDHSIITDCGDCRPTSIRSDFGPWYNKSNGFGPRHDNSDGSYGDSDDDSDNSGSGIDEALPLELPRVSRHGCNYESTTPEHSGNVYNSPGRRKHRPGGCQ